MQGSHEEHIPLSKPISSLWLRPSKESDCHCRRHKRHGFNPWVGKILGVGNGNPLQYSCLENSMDRGIWWATIHGVAKSWAWLSDWTNQVVSLSLPLWFGLVGIYPVPLPSEYFSAFSSCLYFCIWGGLSVFWQFVVPLYCGSSLLWVGLDRWLVKVSWLRKIVSVFWWLELDFFSLECNDMSSNEFWDVIGLGVTLGSLYIEAQGYVLLLLETLRGISCFGTF